MVSPDQIRRTPTLFGKNGLFTPLFSGIAGSIILYFRLLQSEATPIFVLAPLKVVPIALLIYLTLQLTKYGAFPKYAQRIGGGLLFSAAGDVFLEVEGVLGHKALFLSGLVSFLIGHVAYITAFSIGLRRSNLQPVALVSMAVYALTIFLYLRSHPPIHPPTHPQSLSVLHTSVLALVLLRTSR